MRGDESILTDTTVLCELGMTEYDQQFANPGCYAGGISNIQL